MGKERTMNATVYMALLGLAAAGLSSLVYGPTAVTVLFSVIITGLIALHWGK